MNVLFIEITEEARFITSERAQRAERVLSYLREKSEYSWPRPARPGPITRSLTRALEGGGGQILPSPHVFCKYPSKYSFDRRYFFNTCPKINGAPFGAKIVDASILGVNF